MPSGTFTQSDPPIHPPPICISKWPPLIPLLPLSPPARMQGFTRWHDWDPLIPLDVSAYVRMPRVGDTFKWQGTTILTNCEVRLTCEGTMDPNRWSITIAILGYYPITEEHGFPTVPLNFANNWDSGQLLTTYIAGLDTRLARVTM